jgi:hypothetical protein
MNRRAILKEGIYGEPLKVMKLPPNISPDTNSKASQERRLQREKEELIKSLEGAFNLAMEINREGDEVEKTMRFKLRKLINTMMLKLFGKDITFQNLEEGTENLQLAKTFMELVQMYMSSSPSELESVVAKLIDILDKKGHVDVANKLGDLYRKYLADFYRDQGEGNPSIVKSETNV